MNARDTIAAISSAVGNAARAVVRISGDRSHPIARALAPDAALSAGSAIFTDVWPGVRAWVYAFAAPRSYTGEDSIEFHLPGGPVLARMLLDEVVRHGARPAEPGEFTARAYFNGRLDLTQAEGVGATIGATTERELRAARQLLGGELARRLGPVMDTIAEALALVEVGIDFSDEDVTVISPEDVRGRCDFAAAALVAILADSARFERLGHEPRVVLVGRPNAGKSTLLNRLAGAERAVVSEVAGTTRDAIWARARLRRGTVRVIDVAGLEDAGGGEAQLPTDDAAAASIAAQMRAQALRQAAEGDVVVLIVDATDPRPPVDIGCAADLVVMNKSDLPAARPGDGAAVRASAMTGDGVDRLRGRLDAIAFGAESAATVLALNARHVHGIGDARDALGRATAAASARAGAEVTALELREALDALGVILGKVSPDDLLGRVFSKFCIGK